MQVSCSIQHLRAQAGVQVSISERIKRSMRRITGKKGQNIEQDLEPGFRVDLEQNPSSEGGVKVCLPLCTFWGLDYWLF